jgi:Zn finger protein HypA/HybF involved in hydrogenase expression
MRSKWTTVKYIEECKKVHGDKYDYSKVDYKNQQSKVIIICKVHGEFEQYAQHHLRGSGCPKCQNKNMTTEDFIQKATKVHGDKYDYSKVDYINATLPLTIICRIHGDFLQPSNSHLAKHGCPKCDGRNKSNDEIIKKFQKIHGDKYDYSKVNYTGPKNKLIIICKIHGEFEQLYNGHLKGNDCPKCRGKYKTNESVIKEFRTKHGDKYDYSKVDYIDATTKVVIICPEHGEFLQPPNSHLQGYGCRKCWGHYNMTQNEFIEKANMEHNNLYNYSNVDYENMDNKVEIICTKHGSFYKSPYKHLIGEGCPFCKTSKGEVKIKKILDDSQIDYIYQKYFPECKHKALLYFDFYLPTHNMCIEYDGLQHFEPIDFFGGKKAFEEYKIKDQIKTTFCQENNIKLLRINYSNNIEEKLRWLINHQ